MIYEELKVLAIELNNKFSKEDLNFSLTEFQALIKSLELTIADTMVVNLNLDNANFFSKGILERIMAGAQSLDINLVIVNARLSPLQHRNLTKKFGCGVLDRNELIVKIFKKRARTAEGRLQVELADLNYQKTRLVRSWEHLERQRGGTGKTGGPGETQIEIDRRLINDKIRKVKKEIEQVKKTRFQQRQGRIYPTVALVGYTNSGKSTLFNQMTKAKVVAEDKLFATLDPTMRLILVPHKKKVILSDTVGFIADLPHDLIIAFRATLEEVRSADLIIHVHDFSSAFWEKQHADVLKVLAELDINKPILDVYNKIDLDFGKERPAGIFISALSGTNLEELANKISEILEQEYKLYEFEFPLEKSDLLLQLYNLGRIIETWEQDGLVKVKMVMAEENFHKFSKLYVG